MFSLFLQCLGHSLHLSSFPCACKSYHHYLNICHLWAPWSKPSSFTEIVENLRSCLSSSFLNSPSRYSMQSRHRDPERTFLRVCVILPSALQLPCIALSKSPLSFIACKGTHSPASFLSKNSQPITLFPFSSQDSLALSHQEHAKHIQTLWSLPLFFSLPKMPSSSLSVWVTVTLYLSVTLTSLFKFPQPPLYCHSIPLPFIIIIIIIFHSTYHHLTYYKLYLFPCGTFGPVQTT